MGGKHRRAGASRLRAGQTEIAGPIELQSLRIQLEKTLRRANLSRPEFEANYLISEILELAPAEAVLRSRHPVSADAAERLADAAEKRSRGAPLQYVVGRAHFRRLTLEVGPGVLIPRPETELIVDIVLDTLPRRARVGDVGVGSGAIALAIATERPDATVVGVDLCPDALKHAENNRARLGADNLDLVRGDALAPFKNRRFDAVVSNPPYVSRADYRRLPDEIRRHEPARALLAGEHGLDVIRRLVEQAASRLRRNGLLAIEIDSRQADVVGQWLARSGQFDKIEKKFDLNGLVRFVKAVKT